MMIDVVFERRFKPPSTLLVWKPSLHKNLEFLQSQAETIPGFLPRVSLSESVMWFPSYERTYKQTDVLLIFPLIY